MTTPLKSSPFSRRSLTCVLFLLSALGCQSSNSSSSSSTAADTAKPPFHIIRANHPPVSTLITVTGTIQIVDHDDNNKVILKKTKVVPNTLITLNTTGISINAVPITHDPLSRQHTFEFRLYP
ncbi:MAG TPA: hypothetical protein VFE58_07590 [Tepidisphaeraceae bacterium]|nr:hypothetical protein [Tepidisphaeraceae bacterium]